MSKKNDNPTGKKVDQMKLRLKGDKSPELDKIKKDLKDHTKAANTPKKPNKPQVSFSQDVAGRPPRGGKGGMII
ncbi:hypothetical protein BA173_03750 [Rickettsia sp. MEAM1 (Bemisia tabaci)]|uniref:hypothetical protein n=1 Tax=unclassified Rickettsia TaxID=114295 RepID=UPI00082C45E1|nr:MULTISPECIES: hypothetical protein [unclassified Rickettsia]ASX27956.1 hypothetical protein BA173_03750 [Rickettsia sp. MEAM1 (Bemisia tabaci)]ODA37710.1 hypothetical protein A8V34_04930 [Rickettsia sp. wq]ODA37711.1 hypothetical protein A8V33_05585 [Rickettsia sp. wb]